MDHCDRKAATLGTYTPNAFRASLDWRVAPEPGVPTQHFAVLAHEYWHYLQNISTLCGLRGFQADQGLLLLFSKTLNLETGESQGSGELDEGDRTLGVRLVLEQASGLGENGPPNRSDSRITSRVVSVVDNRVEVEIHKSGYHVANESFALGSLAIEESVAFEVESMICDAVGVPAPPAPEFPYRVLSRLIHYYLNAEAPPCIVAGLGTLALLTERPSVSLPALVRQYRVAFEANSDPICSLRHAAESVRESFAKKVEAAKSKLHSIREMHRERGLSDRAAQYIVFVYEKALSRRSHSPLFDLEGFLTPALSSSTVEAHLVQLFEDYPPCDILVRRPDGKTDILSAAGDRHDEHGRAPSQYLRAFDAQRTFMRSHLLKTGLFAASSEVEVACPFLGGCGHPLYSYDRETCGTKPWRHIHSPNADTEGCWYTCGVEATRSRVHYNKSP